MNLKELNQRVKELEIIIQNLENEIKVRDQSNVTIKSNSNNNRSLFKISSLIISILANNIILNKIIKIFWPWIKVIKNLFKFLFKFYRNWWTLIIKIIGLILGGISMFATDITNILALFGLITEIPDNPSLLNLIYNLPDIFREFFNKIVKWLIKILKQWSPDAESIMIPKSEDIINETYSPLIKDGNRFYFNHEHLDTIPNDSIGKPDDVGNYLSWINWAIAGFVIIIVIGGVAYYFSDNIADLYNNYRGGRPDNFPDPS